MNVWVMIAGVLGQDRLHRQRPQVERAVDLVADQLLGHLRLLCPGQVDDAFDSGQGVDQTLVDRPQESRPIDDLLLR